MGKKASRKEPPWSGSNVGQFMPLLVGRRRFDLLGSLLLVNIWAHVVPIFHSKCWKKLPPRMKEFTSPIIDGCKIRALGSAVCAVNTARNRGPISQQQQQQQRCQLGVWLTPSTFISWQSKNQQIYTKTGANAPAELENNKPANPPQWDFCGLTCIKSTGSSAT